MLMNDVTTLIIIDSLNVANQPARLSNDDPSYFRLAVVGNNDDGPHPVAFALH